MVSPENKIKVKSGSGIARVLGGHPVFFSLLTLVIVAAPIFVMLVVPAVKAMQVGGTSSVGEAKSKLELQKKLLADEERLVSAAVGLTAVDRAKINSIIPSESDVPGLVVILGAIAKESDVILTGIDFTLSDAKSQSDLPSQIKPMEIALNVGDSNYERLKIFLANLEADLRLFDVRSITATPTDGNATVELRTYYSSGL